MPLAVDDLTPPEQQLVEHVQSGELLELGSLPTDADEMTTWGSERTIRADVIRAVLLGRLATPTDPAGVQLLGAKIEGRLNISNIQAAIPLHLHTCWLEQGINAAYACVPELRVTNSRIGHVNNSPLDGVGLKAAVLSLNQANIEASTSRAAADLSGADLGLLTCTRTKIQNSKGPAIAGNRLKIERSALFTDEFVAVGAGDDGAMVLSGANIGGQLVLQGAVIRNDSGPAINADGMYVASGMHLCDGFEAHANAVDDGAVRLVEVHTSGQLNLKGATIINISDTALLADGLNVRGLVYLAENFTATGAGWAGTIRMLHAEVGMLGASQSNIRNDSGPALRADGMHVTHDLIIGESFIATGTDNESSDNESSGYVYATIMLPRVTVDGAVRIATDRITNKTNPTALLDVDGMTYTGTAQASNAKNRGDWLNLIRESTLTYAAQPYQQLAAAHRAAGHDDKARNVLIAQRDDQLDRKAITRNRDRIWARFTRLTLGYGYQPWRALIGLATTVAIAIALFVALGGTGLALVAPEDSIGDRCSMIHEVGAGLDNALPLIDTGMHKCAPTDTPTGGILTVTGWVAQAVAWAFATLFVAGFTGAIRKT